MTTLPADPSTGAGSRPGRGLIIAGSIVLALSGVGFILSFAFFGSRVDLSQFERQISTMGSDTSPVPGEVRFRVLEPLTGGDVEVDVGIGTDAPTASGLLSCTLTRVESGDGETDGGESIPVVPSGGFDMFIDPEYESQPPDLVARDLAAGDYALGCESEAGTSGSFFVARTVSVGDILGFAGPVLAMVAALAGAGLASIVGLVLLIVGLVMRSRSKRPPMVGGMPAYPQPWPPGQPMAPPQPWGADPTAPQPSPQQPSPQQSAPQPPGGPPTEQPPWRPPPDQSQWEPPQGRR